ncbi:hypothetical protein cpu_07340 [Carboxydothermus pertinax]|uniref:Uncharacterized protein n=1 Tax=Carboxydothermus pertinax TaxID=870242 RepID=A0A1L8CTP4_9THEO|nr:hypothetical protein cpu_07340 [Carboxydothermus pertinax]
MSKSVEILKMVSTTIAPKEFLKQIKREKKKSKVKSCLLITKNKPYGLKTIDSLLQDALKFKCDKNSLINL